MSRATTWKALLQTAALSQNVWSAWRGEGKRCMLIQVQKVPLVPHEFLKLSHTLVQPRSLNLILLQILLLQWTVSETVILKCKRKRERRRDPSTKAGVRSWQCQLWRFWIHSVGCPRNQRRKKADLRVNKMLCFAYTHRYNAEIVWGKLRPVLTAYLKNLSLTSPPQHLSY